ncbi:DUF2461 domain-containing protein [Kiritimatiellaeota bacterium B1221]|nr:DUF2461 domain-containing protein [Kiritimatiellaeota bacterium B1221]
MIHPDLFPFFRKLAKNNRKDWFNPQKSHYKEMHAVFAEGLDELAVEIAEFDDRVERYLDEPKAVKVFRIYKDSRFQKSPIPLKTNISGLVSSGPEGPFYYVQLGPGESFVGGGIYMPSGPLLAAIREEVAESYEDLDGILADPEFKSLFPLGLKTLAEVKTAPRGYSVDHPAIAHLRKKSFTVNRAFTDEEVLSDDFHYELLHTFEVMHRLNRYLQRATVRVEG